LKNKKYLELIGDFEERKKSVVNIVNKINPFMKHKVEIVELLDNFGPPIVNPDFDSIVGKNIIINNN
jgi:phosphopantetheine adenylyltransferase